MKRILLVLRLFGDIVIRAAKALVDLVSDFLSIWRTGKDGEFSSRRVFATVCLGFGVKALFIGLDTFKTIYTSEGTWYAVFVFLPAALCFVFAAVFSYFSSIKDIKEAMAAAKTFKKSLKE